MKYPALLLLAAVLALPQITHARRKGPSFNKDFMAAYKAGYDKQKAGDSAGALPHFQEAAKAAKGPHEKGPAYVRIGQCYGKLKKYEDAAEAYEKAVKQPIPGARRQNHIHDALKSLNHIYGRILKDQAKIRRLLETQLSQRKLRPDQYADLHKQIAETYEREGKREEAIKWLEKAVAVPGCHPHRKSDYQNRIGDNYNRLKKYDEAIAAYRKTAAMKDGHPHRRADALRSLGDLLRKKKDIEGARKAYSAVLELKEVRPDQKTVSMVRLGEILENDDKKADEALAMYRKAAAVPKCHPHRVGDAQWRVAVWFIRRKRYDEAKVELQKLIDSKAHRNQKHRAQKELEKLNKK